MPKLLDVVSLNIALPIAGLAIGSEGTIVEDFGTAYMIEFLNSEGYTIAVETVSADDVSLVWESPTPKRQSAI